MADATIPALDQTKTYVFEPKGIDLDEKLWDGNTFFPKPGDEVMVKSHREGSNAALLVRPTGAPAGSCLVRSLAPKA